jgi:hypothetical protein
MKGAGKKVFVYSPTKQEPELMYKIYDGILQDVFELKAIFSALLTDKLSHVEVGR